MQPPWSTVEAGGTARQLFDRTDWSATALGAPATWSAALRTTVQTALSTRFPMLVMAGDDLVMAYNDGYAVMLGARHPSAMGRPLREVWSDVWPTIGPMVADVQRTREAVYFEDLPLVVTRNGFDEEACFTFSYSPVVDPGTGAVVAVLNTAVETTGRVLAARRLGVVQQLGAAANARRATVAEASQALVDALATDRADLPVAALFVLDDPADATSPLLVAADHGIPGSRPGTAVDGIGEQWLRSVLTHGEQTLDDLDRAWPELERAPIEVGGGAVRSAVALPLVQPGAHDPIGVLLLGVSPHLDLDEEYSRFLTGVAVQAAAVLGNTVVQLAERAEAIASRLMSETLQRSMLTEPARPDHLTIATRYLPAASDAQVGGDWYDSFLCGDGATWLVVGDVAGHDRTAAAVMGQVRNLLRGIAFTLQDSPAAALTAVDAAMAGLGVSGLTTVVAVRIEHSEDGDGGVRRVRWSNAGHPVPLVFDADGTVTELTAPTQPLLGARPETPRVDHELQLHDGQGLLLYTDGLVERRGADLDGAHAWLVGAVSAAAAADGDLEALCDGLLSAVAGHADDDIALLAACAHRD